MTKWDKAAVFYAAMVLLAAGCTSVGRVGLMTKSGASPVDLVRDGKYDELGPAEASSCRWLLIGVIPYGNADPGYVMERALASTGGDALLNVSTSNSLYGFIPIYNVFSITCTTLKGTAIRFQH